LPEQFCLPRRSGEHRSGVHPRGPSVIVVKVPAHDGGIPVTGERDRPALPYGGAYGACADQFRLLAPHPIQARVHPRGAGDIVVPRPAHEGGIPVTGERDREAT